MAFFQRLFSYLVNEALVNGLANSRTFQRFAIRSNEMFNDLSKKGVEGQQKYSEQAQSFLKTFREEVKKGFEEQSKQAPRR